MHNMYLKYRSRIDDAISGFIFRETRYEPVKYIMSSGGKRIRPVIVLFACDACGGNPDNAIGAAVAVELLHNFTLVHDDIMDNATSRRGIDTVHKKWDVSTAILAGDELIALSYKSLLQTRSGNIAEIVDIFTRGIIEVCEGQAMDKEFEARRDVSLGEYLLMIKKKTAAMIKMSASVGAMTAQASLDQTEAIGRFAEAIGMAFQIQDDLLDVYSSESEFGKKIGGDIVGHKKTYLYLKALELSGNGSKEELRTLFESSTDAGRVHKVIEWYDSLGVIDAARQEVREYTQKAASYLDRMGNRKSQLIFQWLSDMLLNRTS